jgi:hypothetical protein
VKRIGPAARQARRRADDSRNEQMGWGFLIGFEKMTAQQ